MSKRRDPEAVIVDFFTHCPPEAAGILYRVVRGILDARGLLGGGAQAVLPPPRVRSPRRRKTNGGADLADVVDAQE